MRKQYIVITSCIILLLFCLAAAIVLKTNSAKNTTVPEGTQNEISLAEIATHNTANDCWVFIGGQVFNATNVIAQNTEYSTALQSVCGGDGSSIYLVKKYSEQTIPNKDIVRLRESLTPYQIGILLP